MHCIVVTTSWHGGTNAAAAAQWPPLAGRTMVQFDYLKFKMSSFNRLSVPGDR